MSQPTMIVHRLPTFAASLILTIAICLPNAYAQQPPPLPAVQAPAPALAAPAPVPVSAPQPWVSPGHTHYYVDSVNGSDASDGKSPQHPWQTLAAVNVGTFAPGDWILLKAGSHWDTGFSPNGSGADKHPIKVTSYGNGPLPSLDAHATTLATVAIHNGEYWDVENLDISNTSTTPVQWLRGVEVRLQDFGIAHGIVLSNLYVHDIDSTLDKNNGGSGIFCDNHGTKVQSRFDGLFIEDNTLVHTDRNGITMDSGYCDRSKWYPNLNVVIRGNHLTDIGGDCIQAIGCDGALIEYNVVHGGRTRAKDWAAGIWVWSCDNSIIQYNESSGVMGHMDSQGFDADWNTRNTIIQYNYSHDNEGGFCMVVNNGDAKQPGNAGNIGTIVRYNVSQNDGYRIITVCGPTQSAHIYNNDIYVGKADTGRLLFAWNWGGTWPDGTLFSNNIFDVDGKADYDLGSMTNTVFADNDFWGNVTPPPADHNSLHVNPNFWASGTAADGISTTEGYRLQKGSPCRKAGVPIAANGGVDFFDRTVPSSGSPAIGASEQ